MGHLILNERIQTGRVKKTGRKGQGEHRGLAHRDSYCGAVAESATQSPTHCGRIAEARKLWRLTIHPNLAELYRRRVMDLEKPLVDPELGSEAPWT
jgi:hypothetical protein